MKWAENSLLEKTQLTDTPGIDAWVRLNQQAHKAEVHVCVMTVALAVFTSIHPAINTKKCPPSTEQANISFTRDKDILVLPHGNVHR